MTQQPELSEARKEQMRNNYYKNRKKKGIKSKTEFWIEKRWKLIWGEKK